MKTATTNPTGSKTRTGAALAPAKRPSISVHVLDQDILAQVVREELAKIQVQTAAPTPACPSLPPSNAPAQPPSESTEELLTRLENSSGELRSRVEAFEYQITGHGTAEVAVGSSSSNQAVASNGLNNRIDRVIASLYAVHNAVSRLGTYSGAKV